MERDVCEQESASKFKEAHVHKHTHSLKCVQTDMIGCLRLDCVLLCVSVYACTCVCVCVQCQTFARCL